MTEEIGKYTHRNDFLILHSKMYTLIRACTITVEEVDNTIELSSTSGMASFKARYGEERS